MVTLLKTLIRSRLVFLTLAITAMGSQCEPLTKVGSPQADCKADQVEFSVYDNGLMQTCNCGGTAGTLTALGTSFSCTFSVGKTVFVHFVGGPSLRHKLVAVGSPAITDSAVFNPQDKYPIRTYGFAPAAAGTYSFRDEYFSTSIFGTLTVTP